MADSEKSKIPPPGDIIKGDLSTPEKIASMMKDYVKGAIRGATVDLAGTPVDIMNLLISPVTKALGIYSEEPKGGSRHLRELTGQPKEDSLTEMVGNVLTPGGAAHAIIIGAARAGKEVEKAISYGDKIRKIALDEGMSISEATRLSNAATFQKHGVYWEKGDSMKLIPKTPISDANTELSFVNTREAHLINPDRTSITGREAIAHAPLNKYLLSNDLPFEVQSVKVVPTEAVGTAAYFPGKAKIEVGAATSKEGLRGLLLHETQHAIQDIQGFIGRGSNPEAQRQFKDTTIQKLIQKQEELSMRKEGAAIMNVPFKEQDQLDALSRYISKAKLDDARAYTKYLNDPGEQEARFVQENITLSQQQLNEKVLNLIREGKTPQTWDTRPLPDSL